MHRQYFANAGVALTLLAASAAGQLDVSLHMEHSAVLLHEPLQARVTIHNGGIDPVTLNDARGGVQLLFYVERDNGVSIPARQQAPPVKRMVVEPGKTQAIEIDLTMQFAMADPGRYFVRAVLDDGREAIRSRLKMVDVVPGLELAKASGAVPKAPGVQRTYSLRYWARDGKEYAFLCVSDTPSGQVFAPINLGTLVRVARPTVTIDDQGAVTVTHQVNRGQLMVSTLESAADKLTLKSQIPVMMFTPPSAPPATLPPK